MKTMYPARTNSPGTELAAGIDDTQTTIELVDASVVPGAPNLLTIGTDDSAETILYTGKAGNELTGVTRGFQGTAQSWGAGTKVARYMTAYDHDAVRENVTSLGQLLENATPSPLADSLVKRDSGGRLKAAAPRESDDVARKEEVDGAITTATAASQNKIAVYGLAGNSIDPDATTDALILTEHENCPIQGIFYYIHTMFYTNTNSNRAQIAVAYNANRSMAYRRFSGGIWSPWSNLLADDQSIILTGANKGIKASNGNVDTYLNFDFPDLTTNFGGIRFFRETNTTGAKRIDVLAGDGSPSVRLRIENGDISVVSGLAAGINAVSGSPEGKLTKAPGSLCLSTSGMLYVKESGSGNTGWKQVMLS